MPHEMKDLRTAKSYLTKFAEPKLDPKDVCVPNEILKECEEKIKEYREGVKEFRHASAKSKAYHFLYGEEHKDESERKENLQKIFNETWAWFWYVNETFKGCNGSEKIQKYIDELNKDFSKLYKKGYIGQVHSSDIADFPKKHKDKMFNKNKYALFNNPVQKIEENTYAEMISVNYRIFYGNLYALLTIFDKQFAAQVDAAKAVKKDTTHKIDETIGKVEELMDRCDRMYEKMKTKLSEYDALIKGDKDLEQERDRIIEEYIETTDTLSEKMDNIKKINMNAIFKRYFNQDYIAENMQNIQLFNRNLIKFYEIATSTNHKFGDLKKCDGLLVKTFKDLQPTLKDLATTPGRTPASPKIKIARSRAITSEIINFKEKVDAIEDHLRNNVRNFEKHEEDLYSNCKKSEQIRSERRKAAILHTAFIALGLALPILSGLTPLLQAAIASTPASIGPAPQG